MEGITSFFFNIIPGALLILIVQYKYYQDIIDHVFSTNKNGGVDIFLFVMFSIFIGFFLQAFTKVFKEKFLYRIIWCKIEKENPIFKLAENFLLEKKLLFEKKDSEKRLQEIFFLMDDYLSVTGGGRLLPHFASRLAYWSNLFWASLVVIILALFHVINDINISTLSLISLIVSGIMSYIHLKNHYEILLKSFTSYVVIEKQTK